MRADVGNDQDGILSHIFKGTKSWQGAYARGVDDGDAAFDKTAMAPTGLARFITAASTATRRQSSAATELITSHLKRT